MPVLGGESHRTIPVLGKTGRDTAYPAWPQLPAGSMRGRCLAGWASQTCRAGGTGVCRGLAARQCDGKSRCPSPEKRGWQTGISKSISGLAVSDPGARHRTGAQLASLARARAMRLTARKRRAPDGYRTVDHFVMTLRDFCGQRRGSVVQLAAHLDVDESSVRRWLRGAKVPMQRTLDSMEQWLRLRARGRKDV